MDKVGTKFIFSEEEKKEIYDLFVNRGYSQRALQRYYKVSQKPMCRVLDELGLDHSRGNLTSYKKHYPNGIYDENYEKEVMNEIKQVPFQKQKYAINDNYFDDIRNPEVIYVIGLLYADGCNHNCSQVTIALEEKDGYLLQKINEQLKNENQVRFMDKSNKHDFGYDYENQYSLDIYNKRMAMVLNILGVTPRKSLTLSFPRWLHPSLYSCFLKGVFDGDGSLYRYVKNDIPRNTVVTITSTEQFCKAICDIVADQIKIRGHIYDASCHNGVTRVFSICGYDVCKKFLDWLYSTDTICLQRKYDRYCEYYDINNSLSA